MNKFELETERLKIRNFKKNDYNDLFEYLSDRDTYKYEPGEPITLKKAKELCLEREKGNTFFAIELDNKIIGHIYLGQIEPKKMGTWEIGFIFNKNFHRNGYATESVKSLIKYGFKHLKIHKIIAHCNPKNISSWKLLERVNMKREGKLRKNIYFKKDRNNDPIWQDTYEYGILENDI